MDRRAFLGALAGGVLAAPLAAEAQPAGKVYRIGMLERTSPGTNAANLEAFRRGLRELGYVEGKNLVIEYRSAESRDERYAALATELIRLNVDLILTRGTPAALAAKNATATIPVVITGLADPVGQGIVASLAHPGGNITGVSANMGTPALPPGWKEIEAAARSFGLQPQLLDVRKPEALGSTFDGALRQRADALVVGLDTLTQANQRLIVDLAAKHRLPAVYASMEVCRGLVIHGVNYPDHYRRAATFADRIFKGTQPGDLPVERPTKFELVINLKTAKALGLTIPPSLLQRADQVIGQ